MESYYLLSLPVYHQIVSGCFIMTHVRVDFFLNCDEIVIEKYTDALDVLLLLWSEDFSLVGLKHPVTRKHFVPNKLEFINFKKAYKFNLSFTKVKSVKNQNL